MKYYKIYKQSNALRHRFRILMGRYKIEAISIKVVIISNKALEAKRYYFVDFETMRNYYVILISLVLCIVIKYSSTKFLLVEIEKENDRGNHLFQTYFHIQFHVNISK